MDQLDHRELLVLTDILVNPAIKDHQASTVLTYNLTRNLISHVLFALLDPPDHGIVYHFIANTDDRTKLKKGASAQRGETGV